MKLPMIPQDKANHFVYGSIICFLANLIFTPIISLLLVMVVAIGKEVYDKVSKTGNPENLDAVCTILGALPLFILTIIQK